MIINRNKKAAAKSKSRRARFFNGGYTFIELVTVIVILSVLTLFAYPLFSRNNGLTLDAAAKLVKADIRFTQRMAMTDGATRSIIFIQGQSAYTYGVLSDGITPYSRDLAEIDASVFIGSTVTFAFNSLGEPISIAGDTQVSVSTPGESVSFLVTAYTGKITNQ